MSLGSVVLAILAAALLGAGLALTFARGRAADVRVAAPRPGQHFTLGGRSFQRIERASLMLDEYVHEVLLDAGIADPELLPGEQPDEYLDRIYAALHRAKADRPLVAAILWLDAEPAPADEKDLRRVCEETSRFLGTLDGDRDKATFLALVEEILRPFSLRGLPSWLRSLNSTSAPPGSSAASPSRTSSSPAAAGATGRG